MNWVDLIIVLVLLSFVFDAMSRSLIMETLDFLSFLLAFFISFSYYNYIASFFEAQFRVPHAFSLVLGFMMIWFATEIIFYVIARIVFPRIPRIKKVFNVFSVIPALLRGLIFIAIVLVMTATFPIQPSIKKAVLDSMIGSQILKNAYGLEQPIKGVFGGITNDSLTFLTIKPATNERVDLGFNARVLNVDELAEVQMIDLVNKERVAVGLKELVFNEELRGVARMHSEDMFKRGYFAHLSPEGKSVADRADQKGIDFLVIGENLAYAPNLEAAHKGLMNSKGHRENILSKDYDKIGIGVIDGGIYGKMFTQVFSN